MSLHCATSTEEDAQVAYRHHFECATVQIVYLAVNVDIPPPELGVVGDGDPLFPQKLWVLCVWGYPAVASRIHLVVIGVAPSDVRQAADTPVVLQVAWEALSPERPQPEAVALGPVGAGSACEVIVSHEWAKVSQVPEASHVDG